MAGIGACQSSGQWPSFGIIIRRDTFRDVSKVTQGVTTPYNSVTLTEIVLGLKTERVVG